VSGVGGDDSGGGDDGTHDDALEYTVIRTARMRQCLEVSLHLHHYSN